jgi:hypothetical protein
MSLSMIIITGIMFGVEYSEMEDDEGVFNNIIIDIAFLRFVIQWD